MAVLRQRFFVDSREAVSTHGLASPVGGRTFRTPKSRSSTGVTPNLLRADAPRLSARRSRQSASTNAVNGVPHRACFWPMISRPTTSCQIAATDSSWHAHRLPRCRLLFVGSEANENAAVIAEIINVTTPERRSAPPCALGDAFVCYARSRAARKVIHGCRPAIVFARRWRDGSRRRATVLSGAREATDRHRGDPSAAAEADATVACPIRTIIHHAQRLRVG